MNIFKETVYPLLLIIQMISCGKNSTEPSISVPVANDILVDKNATTETANLFSSMKTNAARGVMLGQQDAFTGRHVDQGGPDMTDMKMTCGQHPLVVGLDFMFITDIQNTPGSWFAEQETIIKEQARNCYQRGQIIHFTWHFRNPITYDWFSINSDPERQRIAKQCMASILPGASRHNYYKSVLQKVALVLDELKGSKGEPIPVIFRPFHEFDGNWFWWGKPYCTAEQFIENWQFTVTYLRDELDVHNIIYAFAPDNGFRSEAEYLERYPGDDYVDLVGMDNYSDFESNNIDAAAMKLNIISNYAKTHNKLAALTECGYRNNPKPHDLYTRYYLTALRTYQLELSFMMFWVNNSSNYYVPTPSESTANNFRAFANDERILLEGDIENPYKKQE
ncbi:beta-mannosidase [candidate division KSB1 bacterium]|nr:beta-mannosidase [candidate division KSB1 bacterium]